MTEEEIEKALDEIFKEDTQTIRERMKSLIKSYDNALNDLVENDKKIEKLQKENQQLKDDQLWSEATIEWLKERFIPKERIENKIKYLDSIDEYNAPNGWEPEREYARDILKELLGE